MTTTRAELIFHPVRMRILQALLRRGPATIGDVRAMLSDVAPATLYRHVNRLAEGGVLEVVEERPVRGVVERVYAVSTGGGASLSADDMAAARPEEHLRHFEIFLTGLLGEFERWIAAPGASLAGDRVGYRQFPLYLSDRETDEMLNEINQVIARAMGNAPREDRRRRVLTRILLPGDAPAGAEGGSHER